MCDIYSQLLVHILCSNINYCNRLCPATQETHTVLQQQMVHKYLDSISLIIARFVRFHFEPRIPDLSRIIYANSSDHTRMTGNTGDVNYRTRLWA